MGLFDNKYKKVVMSFETRIFTEAQIMFSTNSGASYTRAKAELAKFELETTLRNMGCKDVEKYMEMFKTDIENMITANCKNSNDQRKLYDDYVRRMQEVAKSNKPASVKKAEIDKLSQQAKRDITDISLKGQLTIVVVQDLYHSIEMQQAQETEAYVTGRLAAMQNAPGARRASAVVRDEIADMMREAGRKSAAPSDKYNYNGK